MMSLQKERLYIYDTTLRDGQQTQGVQFSTDEKIEIAGNACRCYQGNV